VASWAARFLFSGEQLNQPVSSLSGGERARVLIAKLMLQPADILLLDEPTNDLDIATLEILEESLIEYRGALVLVTHDRYMLDRVSNVVIGLNGLGHAGRFADYLQWEEWQAEQTEESKLAASSASVGETNNRTAPSPLKKKLSYLEAREYASIEQRVTEAEEVLRAKHVALEDPAIVTDAARIISAQAAYDAAKRVVDELYARWAELEAKIS
jgi:ATP-binding cassette subfamily F protein uup